MKHRIFIAINLPKEIKNELAKFQVQWQEEIPAKWVRSENLHITLAFLGYLKSEEISSICESIKKITENYSPFFINLNKISFVPYKKLPPKMIWVIGESTKELVNLRNDIKSTLKIEEEPFSPHITLARIRQWEFKKIERYEIPDIETEISLSFEVCSIDLMESHLKRTGPEYITLESFKLGKSS